MTEVTEPQPRWSAHDDAKLLALFSRPPSRGGVSPTDTSKKAIEAVRAKYWPKRIYRNFAPTFCKKASKYMIESAVAGARAGELLRLTVVDLLSVTNNNFLYFIVRNFRQRRRRRRFRPRRGQ